MAFVRAGMIIVALLLSWVGMRSELAAHSLPPQAAMSQTLVQTAS